MIDISPIRRRHAMPPAWARLLATLAGGGPGQVARPERVYVRGVVRNPERQGGSR